MTYRSTWWRPWQDTDRTLWGAVLGLTVIGVTAIFSTGLTSKANDWWQQTLIVLLGSVIALGLARWPYETLRRWHWVTYALANALLVAVMMVGTSALGAERWIAIGGFHLQPSEFAKVAVIVTLAALLEHSRAPALWTILQAAAVVLPPGVLVFIQPNLGTALIFAAITLGMLYWANIPLAWIGLLLSPLVSAILLFLSLPAWGLWVAAMTLVGWWALPWPRWGALTALVVNLLSGRLGQFFWGLLKDYQRDRLILFLDPDKDPLGGGYHLIQSRIAIGSGGLWGQGLFQGTQTQLSFIPEQNTDFIFSVIGEELGFVGSMLVVFLFWLVALRLVLIARSARDGFGSLIAIGVLSMWMFQAVINIGMTVGLAPITGIPLPFLSYGRSAMLANLIALGLVQSVANHRRQSLY
ncbi:MAG: rod shape-determining protein RodA [Gloeomargarita sp. SKYBB_i_bin120]|nr:rod shape-determining protein RodA [Gloeomargarita sp. SKYG98]MCS7291998.1 rod shape-determining protein RodA [Gloeomargarita sp. SKYB120]MDW8177558.1 rod shape-determining protein RodA [Gloeomargarita sp. SKYBB_i_bin120]